MMDKAKKEKLKEPQEEFINEGIANKEKPDANVIPEYEKWPVEKLQEEAKNNGVANYREMSKSELIQKLTDIQTD